MPSYVIAGGGLAAAKAAQTLRDEGFDGEIVLLGAEPERPYERPPLSKGYLQGSDSRDSVYVHPAGWYAEHDVDLRQGVTVTAIDRGAHVVATADGKPVPYDKLLLATGASPRRLDFPGSDREEVLYLRRGRHERQRLGRPGRHPIPNPLPPPHKPHPPNRPPNPPTRPLTHHPRKSHQRTISPTRTTTPPSSAVT